MAALLVGCSGADTVTGTNEERRVATTIVISQDSVVFTSFAESTTLTAAVLDQNGLVMPVTEKAWSSGNEDVVMVSGSGYVLARGNGATTITVRSSGLQAQIPARVEQVAASIVMYPEQDTLWTGGSVTLDMRAWDAEGRPIQGLPTVWSSDDPTVANVADGVVTGEAPGATTIRAATAGAEVQSEVVVRDLVPPSLSALAGGSDVGLQWPNIAADGAPDVEFELRRDTMPGVSTSSTLVAFTEETTTPDTTRIVDTSGALNTTYYYRVFLSTDDGVSAASNEAVATTQRGTQLGASGKDLVMDPDRGVMYVSVPDSNRVEVVSLTSLEVIDRIAIGNRPHGMALSQDGATLYAALNWAGRVAILDLESRAVEDIVIQDSLGHATTFDVLEGAPGEIFVSANPGSGGFAWLVRIDRNNGDSYRRVASDRIIRGAPVLERSPDGSTIFVGEGFRPNSLYALDATDPAAPIVLEDEHGRVTGTSHIAVGYDGSRLYLSGGQVLRADSLREVGFLGYGIPAISPDGSTVAMSGCREVWNIPRYPFDFCAVEIYDATTHQLIRAHPFSSLPEPSAVRWSSDGEFLWLLIRDRLLRVPVGDTATRW